MKYSPEVSGWEHRAETASEAPTAAQTTSLCPMGVLALRIDQANSDRAPLPASPPEMEVLGSNNTKCPQSR